MTDDIDPKAWAEAVKAEHEGKPIWLHLADRPAMVTLIRALLAEYLALASRPSAIVEEPIAVQVDLSTLDKAVRCDLWPDELHAIVDQVCATSDAGDLSTEQCVALGILLDRAASPQPHTGRAGVTEEQVKAAAEALRKMYHGERAEDEPFHLMAKATLNAALTVQPEAGEVLDWQDMSTAPKDGKTHILAYPVLLGRAAVVIWEMPVDTPPMMRAKGENIDHDGYWRLPMSSRPTPYTPTHWASLEGLVPARIRSALAP